MIDTLLPFHFRTYWKRWLNLTLLIEWCRFVSYASRFALTSSLRARSASLQPEHRTRLNVLRENEWRSVRGERRGESTSQKHHKASFCTYARGSRWILFSTRRLQCCQWSTCIEEDEADELESVWTVCTRSAQTNVTWTADSGRKMPCRIEFELIRSPPLASSTTVGSASLTIERLSAYWLSDLSI